jgi:probable F420-dependent oxidoreductase
MPKNRSMQIGISRPPTPTHPDIDVDALVVAQHAESFEFDLLLYGEHPIRPLDDPGAGVHTDGVPFFQDTLVALSRISAGTQRLRFGGGVFLLPEHNPVAFAKQLACLDRYSNGRLIVGAGTGWSRVECELLGGHFERRWDQSREAVEVMRALWTGEPVTYEGEFFTLPPVQCVPTPTTPGGPPILLGGGAGPTLRRVAEWADGWMPAYVTREAIRDGPDEIVMARKKLERMATQAGRDPRMLQIVAIVRGDADRDIVRRFEDVGVDALAVSMPTVTNEQEVCDALERIAETVLVDD